ncbi:hypothetical protein [Niabella aurantiaca]|uniref:hypothetical protein n=1 Tax=Niabella aurantiaca TaxID=379900 RepID=UPI00037053E8|nr:hypothetical protein [Niabella aurantiaca]
MAALKLIKSIRRDLGFIFIGALIVICIIDFWLIDIPEVFPKGHELGQIIYKLCMSYISAFIFYFLVVHIKQQKDKQNLYTYVAEKIDIILSDAESLTKNMSEAASMVLADKYPSNTELQLLSNKIDPHGDAPLLIGTSGNYANWIQYFSYSTRRSKEAIQKVFTKMPFLETELVSILSNLEDTPHFWYWELILPTMHTHKLLLANSGQGLFFKYFELIKRLEIYSAKKLTKYK